MAAWNGGAHANPIFAGDTLYAWTDVLAREPLPGRADLGACASAWSPSKRRPTAEDVPLKIAGDRGKQRYHPAVVLDLDYWPLIPR